MCIICIPYFILHLSTQFIYLNDMKIKFSKRGDPNVFRSLLFKFNCEDPCGSKEKICIRPCKLFHC